MYYHFLPQVLEDHSEVTVENIKSDFKKNFPQVDPLPFRRKFDAGKKVTNPVVMETSLRVLSMKCLLLFSELLSLPGVL